MSYIMNCTKVPISKHKAFDFPLTLLLHSLKGDLITGSQRGLVAQTCGPSVVVRVRMTSISSYEWVPGLQLVDLFGRD